MGLFDFGKKEIKRLANEVQELKKLASNARGFESLAISNIAATLNRNIAIYPDYDIVQNAQRYITTDDIYSIVSRLAQTAALIPLRAYEIKDDAAVKRLLRFTQPHKQPIQTKAIELKALIDLSEEDPLNHLLENPCDGFSKFEWFEAIYTSLYLDGEAIIYKERPQDGKNAGKPVNLLFLHAKNVTMKVTETLPRRIVAYDYSMEGTMIFPNIPPEDIIHIKYFNPDMSYMGNELRGLSPIKVLKNRLAQLDSISNVCVAQLQNGGVETIVYDEAFPDAQAVDIIGQRKDTFYRFLKDPKNLGTPYFASGKMGALHIGSSLADLKVLESAGITFKKLCNVYGTSDILFNNGEASTESNVKEMTMRTYTNTTLPNVYRVRDALITGLLPDFKDNKKRLIREDISEITELQPNMKEMADTLAVSWWVSPNDKLEMMRFERNANPLFDEPLIPAGLQTLDDMVLIPPIDITTPNGN